MKEVWFRRCEKKASKLAADIVHLEKKTEHSILEVNNNIQSVEEMQCQECQKPRIVKLLLTELARHNKVLKII